MEGCACGMLPQPRWQENAAYEFTTPQGQKLLILSLEFAPSDPVLAWAKELAPPFIEQWILFLLPFTVISVNYMELVID